MTRPTLWIALGGALLLDHATPLESLVGLLLVALGVGALESSSQPTRARDGICHGVDVTAGSARENAEGAQP